MNTTSQHTRDPPPPNSPFKDYPDDDRDPSDLYNQYLEPSLKNLNIIQINVEGLSRAKRTYLKRIADEKKADVLCLQETHVPDDAQYD